LLYSEGKKSKKNVKKERFFQNRYKKCETGTGAFWNWLRQEREKDKIER
jgi:hypothetical protein